MDPNANIAEQRQLYKRSNSRLAELVRSLDEWIMKGGFLPADWAATRQSCLDHRILELIQTGSHLLDELMLSDRSQLPTTKEYKERWENAWRAVVMQKK